MCDKVDEKLNCFIEMTKEQKENKKMKLINGLTFSPRINNVHNIKAIDRVVVTKNITFCSRLDHFN